MQGDSAPLLLFHISVSGSSEIWYISVLLSNAWMAKITLLSLFHATSKTKPNWIWCSGHSWRDNHQDVSGPEGFSPKPTLCLAAILFFGVGTKVSKQLYFMNMYLKILVPQSLFCNLAPSFPMPLLMWSNKHRAFTTGGPGPHYWKVEKWSNGRFLFLQMIFFLLILSHFSFHSYSLEFFSVEPD